MTKEENTVWRVSEDDFYAVIKDNYPDLSEEQSQKIIEAAKSNFNIDDWTEWVDAFIQFQLEKNS